MIPRPKYFIKGSLSDNRVFYFQNYVNTTSIFTVKNVVYSGTICYFCGGQSLLVEEATDFNTMKILQTDKE